MINTSIISAQEEGILPGLSALSESDARESAIAFVNMTTSPGLEGAIIIVDDDTRQSEQWRSSLGFDAEFTLKNQIFNGYWGLAIVGGRIDDKMELIGDNGQPVHLDLTRDVVALRGSSGLSFPIDQHFKLRPFLSLVFADLRSESTINGLYDNDNNQTILSFNSKAQLLSAVVSVDAIYSRWYSNYRLELSAQYNLVYTEAVSEDNPILDTDVWNSAAQLESRISGPTNLSFAGRPWRWSAYANFTSFLSHNKSSLGYNNLMEIGASLDWQINIKPLEWFGWQSLGLRAGLIVGENVEGYNMGLTAR